MDTFTTRNTRPAGGHRHHAAQGFCTVCGTAWPCWRALCEDPGRDAVRRFVPPLLASVVGR
jgi:hypothetical protein